MTLTSTEPLSTTTFAVNPDDQESLARIADELVGDGHDKVDSPAWIRSAAAAWQEAPVGLRKRMDAFQRDSGKTGSLLVTGLPVAEHLLGDTPMVSGSVTRDATVPAALLMLLASGLGTPVAFLAEKSGALAQNVVPVPGSEEFQGNEGSVPLTLHNENAFHRHRPDHVLLLCLRADHDRVAGLRTACLREALRLLDQQDRSALFREEFVTAPPPSFGGSDQVTSPHALLSGAREDPDVVVDFAATTPTTPRAQAAMAQLRAALTRTARTVRLAPGDLAVVDNRVALHGRTAFRPRYDGRDRWLMRAFSLRDFRRSRDHRPNDGHVLVR
ncbi:TauD/TfdA family dioxygenase [Kutzneria buriramensis]|uniref:L-asparagine oxygenase n=1 Tax=Kutzneria buriramensis TaxID=1045776 RepID=A0A3E0HQ29_9PSEU|nr:TauD/TfdA family dioxygenase [Kutzneria buriramensis]REH48491.1 L-asparagine oxygenase [Kutzneria buriramensis]